MALAFADAGRNGDGHLAETYRARFFDIDDLSDEKSDLPHMLPRRLFASRMKKMGVGDGKRIVVYDTHGLFFGARLRTFRAMGHQDVAVLNGD
jgi:thiosulfate/3-mercaptopyruvate sulfurtransferase